MTTIRSDANAGLVIDSDTSGALTFVTGNSNVALQIDSGGIINLSSSRFILPVGNTAARANVTGALRFNNESNVFEAYNGNAWINITQIPPFIVEYLVVAGGASGGLAHAGGGGAGGLRTGNLVVNLPDSDNYPVTIGAGGAGKTIGGRGNPGSISVFGLHTASGGGGGGSQDISSIGLNGGSGGGGGNATTGDKVGGSGNSGGYTPVEGHPGGNAGGGSAWVSAGGGGAGGPGGSASGSTPGNGGVGIAISWVPDSYGTPGPTPGRWFAGGGGGCGEGGGTGGIGGAGGGTNGSGGTSGTSSATNNTGGGSGGSRDAPGSRQTPSGSGGSGIVILKYPSSATFINPDNTLVYTTDSATVAGYNITTFTAGTGNIFWR